VLQASQCALIGGNHKRNLGQGLGLLRLFKVSNIVFFWVLKPTTLTNPKTLNPENPKSSNRKQTVGEICGVVYPRVKNKQAR
jgi:hypothetical protein